MSEMSEEARAKAKDKAERLVRSDPRARVDASGYSPEGAMDADVQTGPRPISRRQFRRGGKVAGEASAARADRKPRANGGRTLTADSLINRDVKAANEERDGTKHVGGMKRGGRAHKTMGGLALPNWADAVSRKSGGRTGKLMGGAMSPQQRMGLQQPPMAAGAPPVAQGAMMRKGGGKVEDHATGCQCEKCGGGRVGRKDGGAINDGTRPVAGRLARKGGGRAKKGTNVNIIISQPPARPPMPPMGGPPPGAPLPVGLRQGMPPPMPPAGAPPPGAAPGMPPGAMMPRATGGRAIDKPQAAKKGGGTSTSTGGATAHRNTGAATGGAVTVTISGSSSTDTSTATSTGAKGGAKGTPKGGAGKAKEPPNTINLTVNSTGKSGDAIDAAKPKPRAFGGRAYPIDAGAGSGLGRLEKAQRAARG
jgi:hypothetical protein